MIADVTRICAGALLVLLCGCAVPMGASQEAVPKIAADWSAAASDGRVEATRSGFFDSEGDGLPDTRAMSSDSGVAKLGAIQNGNDAEVSGGPSTKSAPARKLTYAADFAVIVTSMAEATATLTEATRIAGGYLAQQQNQKLTLRVPAARFEPFLATVRKLGRVVSESMRADDVTDRHFDLSMRLENSEKSRTRLLALLEKAKEMKDILQIEESLRRLTTEIEGLKGMLKLLNDRIAMSVVVVELRANAPQVTPESRRKRSRFRWIRSLGIEQDRRRF